MLLEGRMPSSIRTHHKFGLCLGLPSPCSTATLPNRCPQSGNYTLPDHSRPGSNFGNEHTDWGLGVTNQRRIVSVSLYPGSSCSPLASGLGTCLPFVAFAPAPNGSRPATCIRLHNQTWRCKFYRRPRTVDHRTNAVHPFHMSGELRRWCCKPPDDQHCRFAAPSHS